MVNLRKGGNKKIPFIENLRAHFPNTKSKLLEYKLENSETRRESTPLPDLIII